TEHQIRILTSEPGSQPPDLRSDQGRAGIDRRDDRPDRLLAGDQHVAHALDPRRERIEARDLALARPLATPPAVRRHVAPDGDDRAGYDPPRHCRDEQPGDDGDGRLGAADGEWYSGSGSGPP